MSGYLAGRLNCHPVPPAALPSPLAGAPRRVRATAPSALASRLSRASVAALPVALLLWAGLPLPSGSGPDERPRTRLGPARHLLAGAGAAERSVSCSQSPARFRGAACWLAYAVSLVLVLHATPTLLYDTLRYAWAWKHVGLIDYLLRHGATDPHIGNDLAAYQDWPGFFAGNALLIKAAGLRSTLSYAAWGPPFFDLLVVGPLVLIFRRFTQDQRLIWTAVWLFVLGNWVGQDYFSPQAAAYFLYLVVIAITLRWFSSSSVALALGEWRSQTAGVAGPRCRCAGSRSGGPGYSSLWWSWSWPSRPATS